MAVNLRARWGVVGVLVVGLTACGKDARDIALDDVMKAENASLIREQLTTQEQMRLTKHLSVAMMSGGQSDGSKTVGEALDEEAAAAAKAEATQQEREADRKAREENFYAAMGDAGKKTAAIKDPRMITLAELYADYPVRRAELAKVMSEDELNLVAAYMQKNPPFPGQPSAHMTVASALEAARKGH